MEIVSKPMLERTRRAYKLLESELRLNALGVYRIQDERLSHDDIACELEAVQDMLRAIEYNLTDRVSDLITQAEKLDY
jgi:hypothetical protein